MGRALGKNDRGTAMVEMAVVFPMVLLLTLAIMEFGTLFAQALLADKATEVGVRYAVTSDMVATGVPDCGVATNQPAGTPCRNVAGSDAWTVTCTAGSGGCSAAAFNDIVTQMQRVFPLLTPANVVVRYSGTGLGFVGRGSPVPDVSVSLQGLTFTFVALDTLIGLPAIPMPGFRASLLGEDLQS